MRKRIRVTQQRDGKTVSFYTKDKGKPGKTPEDEKWYQPTLSDTGWSKDLPEDERRTAMLQAHKGDYRAAGRALMSLANVTTDMETSRKARADALYFYRQLRKSRPISSRRVRITPKVPKLR